VDALKTFRIMRLPILAMALASIACGTFNGFIGDKVWLDENRDGLQSEPGDQIVEPGVPGVLVDLLIENTYGQNFYTGFTVVGSDVTDDSGHYQIQIIEADQYQRLWNWQTYYLYIHLPPGYEFTLPKTCPPNYGCEYYGRDSDPDPSTGIITFNLSFLGNSVKPAGDPTEDHSEDVSKLNSFDAGLVPLLQGQAFVSTLTPTGESTATPEAGASGDPVFISVTVDTNCRSGPRTNYPALATISAGERVEVVAVFPGSEYVVVKLPSGGECWLWLRYATTTDFSGNKLPVATQPPTPTPTDTPRPTKTPMPPSATPTPTRRPIG
jgi:hypothetical protein